MNIFIINGAQKFAHSSGAFNETLNNWTVAFFKEKGFEFRTTNINDEFDSSVEVENFKWADMHWIWKNMQIWQGLHLRRDACY